MLGGNLFASQILIFLSSACTLFSGSEYRIYPIANYGAPDIGCIRIYE
jgi:hypothetical protein